MFAGSRSTISGRKPLIAALGLLLFPLLGTVRAQSSHPITSGLRGSGGFSSIQGAIDAAAPGDTICVPSGRYEEALVINKSLTLLGGCSNTDTTPVIAPPSGFSAVSVPNPPAGTTVIIEGFEIQSQSGLGGPSAIAFEVGILTVKGNVFRGTGSGTAIATYLPASVQIIANQFHGFTTGVSAANVSGLQVDGNAFENVLQPLYLTECTDATVFGNLFTNIIEPEWLKDPDHNPFRRSVAINLTRCRRSFVQDNVFCNQHIGILTGGGSDLSFVGNLIKQDMETEGDAILIGGSTRVTVKGNRIEDFDYCMDFVGAVNVEVHNNIFEDAELGLVNGSADPEYMVHAEGNWWGDSSGPSGEGPGRGVTVSENIDFDDWLTKPAELKDVKCPGPLLSKLAGEVPVGAI